MLAPVSVSSHFTDQLVDDLILALSTSRGLDEVVEHIRGRIRRIMGADGVTFILREGDFCHYVYEDSIAPLWQGQKFRIENCVSGWAMTHAAFLAIEDIYTDSRVPIAVYRPTFVKSLAMTPVRRDDPVAAIGVYWANRHVVTAREQYDMERIANGASVALTNISLLHSLREARAEAERAKDAIIHAMATLAEVRDNETGNHIFRTQHFVRALAISAQAEFPELRDDSVIEVLFKSAPLHDIGKVGVPDKILLKPGPLDAGEIEIMRTHPELGRRAIAAAEKLLEPSTFLLVARDIAFTHHEKWDGSGYPQGLRGEDIPLPGRIMAVADVYDALVSKRIYKEAVSHEEAVRRITADSGRHFDPRLVDAFLRVAPEFDAIHQRFIDF